MFDIIPYWMWAASLVVLALLCGAALSRHDEDAARRPVRQSDARRTRWRLRG